MATGGTTGASKTRAAALMMALSSAQAIDARTIEQGIDQDGYTEASSDMIESPLQLPRQSYTQAQRQEQGDEGEEEKGAYLASPEAEQEAQRARELQMRKHQERFTGTSALPTEEHFERGEGTGNRTGRSSTLSEETAEFEPGRETEDSQIRSEAERAGALLALQAQDQAQKQEMLQQADQEEQDSALESSKQQKRQMKSIRQLADIFGSEGVIPFIDLVIQRNKDVLEYYFSDVSIGQLFITLWMDVAVLLAPIFQLAVFLIPLTPLIALAAGIAWFVS